MASGLKGYERHYCMLPVDASCAETCDTAINPKTGSPPGALPAPVLHTGLPTTWWSSVQRRSPTSTPLMWRWWTSGASGRCAGAAWLHMWMRHDSKSVRPINVKSCWAPLLPCLQAQPLDLRTASLPFCLACPQMRDTLVNTTVHYIKVMLGSSKLKSITSERTLLKNLGAWLGKLTLANNRPVLQARGGMEGDQGAAGEHTQCAGCCQPCPAPCLRACLQPSDQPCPAPPPRPPPAEAHRLEADHPGGVRAGQDAGGAVLCAHAVGASHGLARLQAP